MVVVFSQKAFNPRSYKRSDVFVFCQFCNSISFNPRSYKRSDALNGWKLSDIKLSIHAPTRGATILISSCVPLGNLSIHAPTRGATRVTMFLLNALILSIHAPTRGATVDSQSRVLTWYFQSTLLQEERRLLLQFQLSILHFQSTLLQEERRLLP